MKERCKSCKEWNKRKGMMEEGITHCPYCGEKL